MYEMRAGGQTYVCLVNRPTSSTYSPVFSRLGFGFSFSLLYLPSSLLVTALGPGFSAPSSGNDAYDCGASLLIKLCLSGSAISALVLSLCAMQLPLVMHLNYTPPLLLLRFAAVVVVVGIGVVATCSFFSFLHRNANASTAISRVKTKQHTNY